MDRRHFLKKTSLTTAAAMVGSSLKAQENPEITVLNPRNRVPLNFIIDDSTALVNLAYFGIPQFKQTWPERYTQDWRSLPPEIPDSFVMEFMEWCESMGVKGKYSMVPYPACTGWLHRFIPGWSQSQLQESLRIVRDVVTPNWDIHPEMISHTRVVDIKSGLPFRDASPEYMENWEWSQTKSADELGEYISYAMGILKETGFSCDGLTTPGGFGSRNMPNLAMGTLDGVSDVFGYDVAHFFRNVVTDPEKSVSPQILHVSGLETDRPKCSVHIIGCTNDWFGGWDGLTPGDPDKFITHDLSKGRLVEVIDSEEPAILVCHWPGIYYNGEKTGFSIFKTVVKRLNEKYNNLLWMKLTDIARYWAAREFTNIDVAGDEIHLNAPFATKNFTLSVSKLFRQPVVESKGLAIPLKKVSSKQGLEGGTWAKEGMNTFTCFDLPTGKSILREKG